MEPFDFVINVEHNRDIKILQLTDFQPVDFSQQRFAGRLNIPSKPFTDENRYDGLFFYIEQLISKTNPDLIIVTGDNVYGEFDDNGFNHISICHYLDSFNIPWAPVFGNHDNESKMGVAWQCNIFNQCKHCLFKRRELTGNGNYNIGIKRNNKIEKVIYMIDSNGCSQAQTYEWYYKDYPAYNLNEKVETRPSIFQDQVKWIDESAKAIDDAYDYKITKFMACHIPPDFVAKQAINNGYTSENDEQFDLELNHKAINNDFGHVRERFIPTCFCSNNLLDVMKQRYFNGLFVGHNHITTLSILCNGFLRVTFGMKTGEFDYHDDMGGTLITLRENDEFDVKHIKIEKEGK